MQANDTQELIGRKVKVYYNLHRKQWSIQDHKTRRVIGHTDFLKLANVVFKVSRKGRERVLREKKKNVHAFAIGTIEEYCSFTENDKVLVLMYNPYKYKSFVNYPYGNIVNSADIAWFQDGMVFVKNGF